MNLIPHQQMSDEELLKECDKQYGNPLVVELHKRLASCIDSQTSYEAEIDQLTSANLALEKANEALVERNAELMGEVSKLNAEAVSLKDTLELLS